MSGPVGRSPSWGTPSCFLPLQFVRICRPGPWTSVVIHKCPAASTVSVQASETQILQGQAYANINQS
jgi:hypothetical protein